MEKTVFISLPIADLQTVIIDCVNACLKNSKIGNHDHQTEADDLLTVQAAAKFLSLSVPTIYGLIHRGEIPVMKRSKRCYFSKVELINYLKEGRKMTVAENASEISIATDAFLSNLKKTRG